MNEFRFDRLEGWLEWQQSIHPAEIELKLERIREVAGRLKILQPAFPIVTVAGTNGKGSSVAMLDAIFQAAGYRTGAYTSPYLYHYNERIAVSGIPCEDGELIEVFKQINAGRGDVPLTYFEFSTLAAVLIFSRRQVDVAILEVGLGGRLDAVNVWDADVALIASIGIDHVEWLGDDRESIGREKAGIMRPGRPVVCGDPQAPQSIREYADEVAAELYQAGEDYSWQVQGGQWRWQAGETVLEALPIPNLRGDFQLGNAANVIAVLRFSELGLNVDVDHIRSGLSNIRLQGRLQQLTEQPQIMLDVAHNAHAAARMGEWLKKNPVAGKTHAVFSILADKDVEAVLETLDDEIDHWWIFPLKGERALDLQELQGIFRDDSRRRVTFAQQLGQLWQDCSSSLARQDRVMVFGSFYVLAEFRQVFEQWQSKN